MLLSRRQPAAPAYTQPAQQPYTAPAQSAAPAYSQPAQPAYTAAGDQPAQPAYGTPAAAPAYGAAPGGKPPKAKGGKKKKVLIISIIVAVLLAGAAVWFFFLRGGDKIGKDDEGRKTMTRNGETFLLNTYSSKTNSIIPPGFEMFSSDAKKISFLYNDIYTIVYMHACFKHVYVQSTFMFPRIQILLYHIKQQKEMYTYFKKQVCI